MLMKWAGLHSRIRHREVSSGEANTHVYYEHKRKREFTSTCADGHASMHGQAGTKKYSPRHDQSIQDTEREKKKKQSTGHYTHWNKHTESVRVKAINSNLSTRFYRPSVAETQQPKIFSKRMCEQVRKTHPSVQCCSTLFHLLCDIRHM